MSNYTDEEIGAALREYWEANGGDIDAQPPAWRDATAHRLMRNDHNTRTPYTTEDLRAALAAEAAIETEPLNLDIWSDEHAPERTAEPLLEGVFGAESTVPEWLTQEEERYATTGSVDAPSIFDGVEVPELTPAQVAEMVPLREGFRWHVGRSGDLDLEMSDEGNLVGWVCARRAAWTVDLDNETEVHDAGNLLANARALARHCGALAEKTMSNLIPSGPSLARILDPWHCPKTTRGQ